MTVVRYGIAGVCVIAAVTLARWLPPEAVADGLLLFAAVVITGRVSGLGPALVACGLATLAFEYYVTSSLDQHGGRLWATANATRGVTLYFALPVLEEVPPETDAARPA